MTNENQSKLMKKFIEPVKTARAIMLSATAMYGLLEFSEWYYKRGIVSEDPIRVKGVVVEKRETGSYEDENHSVGLIVRSEDSCFYKYRTYDLARLVNDFIEEGDTVTLTSNGYSLDKRSRYSTPSNPVRATRYAHIWRKSRK